MPRADLDELNRLPVLVASQFRLETGKVVTLHRLVRERLLWSEPRGPVSMGARLPYATGVYDADTNPTFQEVFDRYRDYPVSLDMFEIKALNASLDAYEKKLKEAQQPCTLLGYYELLIPLLMLEPRRLLLKKRDHAAP